MEVTVMPKETVIRGDELREVAQRHFSEMQISWFKFASVIKVIKDNKEYEAFGYSSFKAYCEDDFPSIDYNVIIKIVKVVTVLGSEIREKLSKDESYKLPAYESCYKLTTLDDRIDKKELKNLKKKVLSGGLSYQKLKDALKVITDKKASELDDRVDKTVEEIEAELIKDIGEESEEYIDDIHFDEADDEEIMKIKNLSLASGIRVDYLKDNLNIIQRLVVAHPDALVDEVVELAENLNILHQKIDKFLETIEEY